MFRRFSFQIKASTVFAIELFRFIVVNDDEGNADILVPVNLVELKAKLNSVFEQFG